MNNVATHSNLNFVITGKSVKPTIELNSITLSGEMTYFCSGGEMTIEKNLRGKEILKATFDLNSRTKRIPI